MTFAKMSKHKDILTSESLNILTHSLGLDVKDGVNGILSMKQLKNLVEIVTLYKCKSCEFSSQSQVAFINHLCSSHLRLQPIRNDQSKSTIHKIKNSQVKIETFDTSLAHKLVDDETNFSPFKKLYNRRKSIRTFKRFVKEAYISDDEIGSNDIRQVEKTKKLFNFMDGLSTSNATEQEMNTLSDSCEILTAEIFEENKYPCIKTSCNCRFKKSETLEYHIRCHNSDYLQCPECLESFKRWQKLRIHLWHKHKIDMDLYTCSGCGYKTDNLSRLAAHKIIHRKDRSFTCFKCGESFNELNQLRSHAMLHSKRDSNVPLPIARCDTCNKTFSDYKCLQRHKFAIHSMRKPYTCNICGYSTKRLHLYRLHARKHAGGKPFLCKYCDYCTDSKSTLHRHKMVHVGEKPYKCFHCNYESKSNKSFKKHLFQMHPGSEGLYCCTLCPFRSINKQRFTRHMIGHESIKAAKTNLSLRVPVPMHLIKVEPDSLEDSIPEDNPDSLSDEQSAHLHFSSGHTKSKEESISNISKNINNYDNQSTKLDSKIPKFLNSDIFLRNINSESVHLGDEIISNIELNIKKEPIETMA